MMRTTRKRPMADWIVLACAAMAAVVSTYAYLGEYHRQWRDRKAERD